jgi:hypothetical protein
MDADERRGVSPNAAEDGMAHGNDAHVSHNQIQGLHQNGIHDDED